MMRVELHHYPTSAGTSRTVAHLAVDPPESGKAWTTREACGHRHRSDEAAVNCARVRWAGVIITEPGGSR